MGREPEEKKIIDQERTGILQQYEGWVEIPSLVLAVGWLILLVIDLTTGLNPFLVAVFNVIWIIFILDFFIRFFLAPEKVNYIKHNWLTAISLAIPALRIFQVFRVVRVLRAARAARGINLVRVVSTVNRGMRSLSRSFSQRGFGYLLGLTLIVILAGAGGMFAFESRAETGTGFDSYGDALWWTAMMLTTIGSDYWPQTAEGRVLAFLLSIYAIGVFGYFTATLASFFIGQEAEGAESKLAGQRAIVDLQTEVRSLREEISRFNTAGNAPSGSEGSG